MKTTKENGYIKAIYTYGIVPVLLLLKEYENKEQFEECALILEAIQDVNTTLKVGELPTRYDNETLPKLKEQLLLIGMQGDVTMANMPHYIQEIKKLMLEWKKGLDTVSEK